MSVMSVVVEEDPEEEENARTAPDSGNNLLIGSGSQKTRDCEHGCGEEDICD
jgi:hypothetical protein